MTRCLPLLSCLVLAAAPLSAALAQAEDAPQSEQAVELTAAQLFAYADAARDRSDFPTAEAAYQALMQDPDPELQTEARFRLGRMYADMMDRPRDAAVLYRRILDEKPDAVPVRLELARVLARMGNLGDAQRELRAAEASGQLPPQVEQQVRFFANALSASKRFGGGFEVALAPSTNINNATRSDTLGTIIGDFTLDDDAQAQSGIGLSLRGQMYYRLPVGTATDILARVSSSGDLYSKSDFNDFSLSTQVGPQWRWGSDRFALAGAVSWRWYGMAPYTMSYGAIGNWQHPLGGQTQLRLDGTFMFEDNRRNDLEDGHYFTLAAGIDHAFTARSGGGIQINGMRDVAQDPGYSTASGGANAYLYREMGRTTAVVNVGYRHLEADARLFLYPERRRDDNFSASLSGTFRALTFGTFAPMLRVKYQRNWSTVEIYDFDSVSAEAGLVAAF